MTVYTLSKNVDKTVTIDGTTYGSPFVLEAGFTIRPEPASNGTYIGLTSSIDNAYLTVSGSVYGSAGSSGFSRGPAGGIGVDLTLSGDYLLNNNNVSGGAGGNSNGGGYGGYGGAGGTGLNLVGTGSTHASSNDGAITGGQGGNASTVYGGGAGGIGLNLAGAVLGNIGRIVGGAGGSAAGDYAGAAGAGAVLGTGATLNNSGSVTGGTGGGSTGGIGRAGGAGVSVGAGATLNNQGTHSAITGGNGGTGANLGGTGGVGVSLATGATFTGAATIKGGNGGVGGFQDGNGGDGVDVGSGVTLTNTGSIVGGNGYTVLAGLLTTYAKAGAGVVVDYGRLNNFGSISAGTVGRAGSLGGVYLQGGTLFTDGHIDGGGTSFAVNFGLGDSTMTVDTGATFGGGIGGFASGDVIDLLNVDPQQVEADVTKSSYYQNGNHYTAITIATGADGTLSLLEAYSAHGNFHYYTDNNGGTDLTIACFLKGTKISTAGGETPVEDLDIGHCVVTRGGLSKPIKWIGRRSYAGRFAAQNPNIVPVLIRAGALADGIPHRDLHVSPMHAMYLDGMLIPAIDLVNGVSIVQLETLESIEYLHIELSDHDVIFAEGAATESYVDDDNRMMFSNARDYYDRNPQGILGACLFCAPRVSEGYELEAVRRKLAVRAGLVEPAARKIMTTASI